MTDGDVAMSVVQRGAEIVRRRFGGPLLRVDKGAGDFATSVDLEAEAAMIAELRRCRPNDRVYAEEAGQVGPVATTRQWLIDPLCGTLNYAAGMQVVAVNVALESEGRCTVAAVADPFTDEVYWTESGVACVRRRGSDIRLTPSRRSQLVDLNLDPPFPNAPRFKAGVLAADDDFLRLFKPRVVSSTQAVVWVGTGQRAGYVTDGHIPDKSVHFTAGVAICEAAGCTVTDLRGGPWGLVPSGLVIGSDPETHGELLRVIAKFL